MKRYKWLTLGIIVFILPTLLTGCILTSQYEALQKENSNLLVENTDLQAKLEMAQTELRTAQLNLTSLQAQLETAQAELDNLQVKRFPSAEVLETWLAEQPAFPVSSDAILWYSHGLQLQEAALADGYIINVELTTEDETLYSVLCSAVLEDNSYYWWDPETDEIYFWLDIRRF